MPEMPEVTLKLLEFVVYFIGCFVSWYLNVFWRMKAFSERPWTWVDEVLQLLISMFSWATAVTGLVGCVLTGAFKSD